MRWHFAYKFQIRLFIAPSYAADFVGLNIVQSPDRKWEMKNTSSNISAHATKIFSHRVQWLSAHRKKSNHLHVYA
jgi:hypothetical protein